MVGTTASELKMKGDIHAIREGIAYRVLSLQFRLGNVHLEILYRVRVRLVWFLLSPFTSLFHIPLFSDICPSRLLLSR